MTPSRIAGKLYVVAELLTSPPYDTLLPFCCPDAPSLKSLTPTSTLTEPANITWLNKFFDPRRAVIEGAAKKTFGVKLTGLPNVSLSGTLLALAHPRAFVEPHCTRCEGVQPAQAIAKGVSLVSDGRSAKGNCDDAAYIAGIIGVARVSHVELAMPRVDSVTLARCSALGVEVTEANDVPRHWSPPRWL
jgi:hypothetical protein